MTSLVVYMLRSYTLSQRYFAPFASIIIAVLVLYSYTPNPVMNSYAATAVILFTGCAWLGLSFLNHEHPVQRQLTTVHLRSIRKYNMGSLLTLGVLILLLDLLIVVYPLVTGRFDEKAGLYRIMLALVGHALLGMLGIAISLFLQSSMIKKASHATGILLGVIIVSIGGTKITELLPGSLTYLRLLLPPVSSVMDAMMNADQIPGVDMLIPFLHIFIYTALLIGFYSYIAGKRDMNKN
ncbi:hypothetical protein [Paenibacillus sp. GCM10012306]|uniref:hypothetical protein n=1 Tax=Paenibacillus sp. GCM10012306 TaxID=3317342 RepID=UPI00361DFE5B